MRTAPHRLSCTQCDRQITAASVAGARRKYRRHYRETGHPLTWTSPTGAIEEGYGEDVWVVYCAEDGLLAVRNTEPLADRRAGPHQEETGHDTEILGLRWYQTKHRYWRNMIRVYWDYYIASAMLAGVALAAVAASLFVPVEILVGGTILGILCSGILLKTGVGDMEAVRRRQSKNILYGFDEPPRTYPSLESSVVC
jgi:hypothetical protein